MRPRTHRLRIAASLTLLLFIVATAAAFAQPRRGRGRGRMGGRPGAGENAKSPKEEIKPYDEVITDEATTDSGLFLVHRLDNKVFFEIPAAELGKEFLWVAKSHII